MFRLFGRRSRQTSSPATTAHPNAALVEAMMVVARDDREKPLATMFRLLLDATLFLVTPTPMPGADRTTGEAESVRVVTETDEDGVVLMVFTSLDSLRRWRPDPAGYVAMTSRAIFEMAAEAEMSKIAIDMGSPGGGLIDRRGILELSHGRAPLGNGVSLIFAGAGLRLGVPAEPPSAGALEALRIELGRCPQAVRAWYCQMDVDRPSREVKIVFLLDGSGRGDEIIPKLINAAASTCPDVNLYGYLEATKRVQLDLEAGAGVLFYARP